MTVQDKLQRLHRRLVRCPSSAQPCLDGTYFKRPGLASGTDWYEALPPSAHHPLLFDHPAVASGQAAAATAPAPRLMIIGAIPGTGSKTITEATRGYLRANRNASPLGWFSGYTLTSWLAEAYLAVGNSQEVLGTSRSEVVAAYERVRRAWPRVRSGKGSQAEGAELDAAIRAFRVLVPVHVSNIVKCHSLIKEAARGWQPLADACAARYLRREVDLLPSGIAIVPLGKPANAYLARRFDWPDLWGWWEADRPVVRRQHRLDVDGRRYWLYPFLHPGRPRAGWAVTRLAGELAWVLRRQFRAGSVNRE